MPDLRHDPDAPETQHDPRSFEARMLEAAQRGIEGDDGQPRDTRTFPEMVVAELVRWLTPCRRYRCARMCSRRSSPPGVVWLMRGCCAWKIH